jgi:hypothetical protein
MTQTQFVQALKSVQDSYKWVYKNNQLVGIAKYGTARGVTYTPVQAVCRTLRKGDYNSSLKAGKRLGLSEELIKAMQSTSNRGHAQIIRGQMLNILDSDV